MLVEENNGNKCVVGINIFTIECTIILVLPPYTYVHTPLAIIPVCEFDSAVFRSWFGILVVICFILKLRCLIFYVGFLFHIYNIIFS